MRDLDIAKDGQDPVISITAIGLAAITIILIATALLHGPWIDEFWSLQLSDLSRGVVPLIRDGWLHDTHPPFFNLWATILSALGVRDIPIARLLTNLPALLAMIYTGRRFAQRLPDQRLFHAALLLLVLSLAPAVEAFGNYRSYFWQIAAITILVQAGRHIAMVDKDLDGEDRGLAAITVFASAGAIMLHYVGGLFGAALSLALLLCAITRGFRRWALLLGVTMAVACTITMIFAWAEASHWAVELDYNWIRAEAGSAIGIVTGRIVRAVVHNPAPLIGIAWIRGNWRRKETRFVVTIGGALLIALPILLAINARNPIIVSRYLIGLSVLICALMASLAAKFRYEKKLLTLLAAISAATVTAPFLWHGPRPEWQENAREIAKIVRQCPSTRVYATTGWILRDGAGSQAARREDPVFALGYKNMGADYGFAPNIIGPNGPVRAILGDCPILLWIEHAPAGRFSAPDILAAARLTGLEKVKLSIIRSESGLIVRADRQ